MKQHPVKDYWQLCMDCSCRCPGKGFHAVAKNGNEQPLVTWIFSGMRHDAVFFRFSGMQHLPHMSYGWMQIRGGATFRTCASLGTHTLLLRQCQRLYFLHCLKSDSYTFLFCTRNYYKLLHHGSVRIEDVDVRICSDVRHCTCTGLGRACIKSTTLRWCHCVIRVSKLVLSIGKTEQLVSDCRHR